MTNMRNEFEKHIKETWAADFDLSRNDSGEYKNHTAQVAWTAVQWLSQRNDFGKAPDDFALIEKRFVPVEAQDAGIKAWESLKGVTDDHTVIMAVFEDMVLAADMSPYFAAPRGKRGDQ